MVLETLVGVKDVWKDPFKAFLFGVIISFVALFVSYTVFPKSTGLFTVIIITIASIPTMSMMLRFEEDESVKMMETHSFLERYGDIILAYVTFFSGMIIAMSLSFVLLPEGVVGRVFSEQITEVNLIRGKFEFGGKFTEILLNNISVLTLSFLFSFLFGSGAIFILAWNATVLSAAIGLIAESSGGLKSLPSAVMMFLPHGSFEIGAYFIGAIAGGLVSVTISRRKSVKFWMVVKDSVKLLVLSFVFLFIGAMIETMIIVF